MVFFLGGPYAQRFLGGPYAQRLLGGSYAQRFFQGALFEFISKQYMFYTCPTGRSTYKECNIFTLFPDVLTKANSFPDTINTESSSNPVSKENKMNTILSPVL